MSEEFVILSNYSAGKYRKEFKAPTPLPTLIYTLQLYPVNIFPFCFSILFLLIPFRLCNWQQNANTIVEGRNIKCSLPPTSAITVAIVCTPITGHKLQLKPCSSSSSCRQRRSQSQTRELQSDCDNKNLIKNVEISA